MQMRLRRLRCSTPIKSATISRAERKAVSPEVIAQATTPKITNPASTSPSVSRAIASTITAACPPYSAIAAFSPPTPFQNAMATAAQIRAMMLSEIMAP